MRAPADSLCAFAATAAVILGAQRAHAAPTASPPAASASPPAASASPPAASASPTSSPKPLAPVPGPAVEPPPRPPLPPEEPTPSLPWGRDLELAGSVVVDSKPVSKTFDLAGNKVPTPIRFAPAIGFGLHAAWQMHRFLRFTTYFVDARHSLAIPESALHVPGVSLPLQWAATQGEAPVYTYNLGARLAATLPLGARFRTWAGAGIGWGRLEYPRLEILPRETLALPGNSGLPLLGGNPGRAAQDLYQARERADSYAEVPIGVGCSFDVIPHWIAVELNVSAAYVWGQGGNASGPEQAITAQGRRQTVGALPLLDTSIQQTLGLALIL